MGDTAIIGRKEQISNVAQNMFRERGYPATSMRDLAGVIGIEPASLYSHYKSKEEILQGICFRIADEFFQAIKPIQTASIEPVEKLKKAIQAHISVITDNVDASAVFLHDWRYLTDPQLSEFIQLRKEYENFYRTMLKQGIKQGIFRDEGETFMVLTLFSALNWIYDWYKPDGDLSAAEIGEKLGELIINGIKNSPD